MPASTPKDIRNVVLAGHGGAGKTTLAEAMLHAAKVTTRLGSVEDGTSILDHTDIEKERQHSVEPSMAHFDHLGKTINIIDSPGYPDFVGGAIGAMLGADVALVCIGAAAGIEVNTRRLFKVAEDLGLARAIVINKLDGENVDPERLLREIAETFGAACRVMTAPSDGRKAVIDCFTATSGASDFGDVGQMHTQLVESIVEADEKLMEAYLAGEQVPADKLIAAFDKAMIAGTVIPIFFTSARNNVGVTELMDAIARYFPSPAEVTGAPVRSSAKADAENVAVKPDPSAPFVAQAFKITSDPFVGKLAWVRILQGSVTPETVYHLHDDRKGAKVAHLFKVQGKETHEIKQAVAGDIIALAKVEEIKQNDVLHADVNPMFRKGAKFPTPMYSLAVMPKTRGDEQKISGSLHRLSEEDPTFAVARDAQTGETVISGIGDLHLRVMLMKMKQRFDMDVETKQPKIPYHETISQKADGHYRHKKQTGGAGQFGEVYLRIEPLERGAGFEFADELFGESIPRQYLPSIEKGVREVLENGAIAGYRLSDLKVAVTDGKYHPVDSKDIAFRTAGKYAFLDAIEKARPVLLEPIVHLDITVPAVNMGDIAGDLSGRRGRIIGQDMLPGNMCVIKAQAPLSEVMQYNSQLRSVTAGQGSYTMELSHYEPVPSHVQQQIVAASQKAKEEDKDK